MKLIFYFQETSFQESITEVTKPGIIIMKTASNFTDTDKEQYMTKSLPY